MRRPLVLVLALTSSACSAEPPVDDTAEELQPTGPTPTEPFGAPTDAGSSPGVAPSPPSSGSGPDPSQTAEPQSSPTSTQAGPEVVPNPTVPTTPSSGSGGQGSAGGIGSIAMGGATPTPSGMGGVTVTPSGGASGNQGTGGSIAVGGAGADAGGCPVEALFCDDFETGSLSDSWVLRVNGDGVVDVDAATPAHSGTHSVRVNATGYQTFFALSDAPVFPIVGESLYVRVYLLLSEAMTTGHNTYFEAGPSTGTDEQYETRIGVQQAMFMINQPAGDRGFLANENFYNDQVIGASIPAETWGCLEAYFDPPSSEIRVWLDGVEIEDLHRTDWQQDPINELRFGYEKYAGPNTVLWFDDVVVSTTMIGCN